MTKPRCLVEAVAMVLSVALAYSAFFRLPTLSVSALLNAPPHSATSAAAFEIEIEALLKVMEGFTYHNRLANWSRANSDTLCYDWYGVICQSSNTPIMNKRVVSLQLANLGLEGFLSPFVGNLSSLTSLDLSVNKLHGTIPTQVALLRRLEQLNLGSNYFQGSIPSEIGRMQHLVSLDLYGNQLSGGIPQSISNCSALQNLSLEINGLSGEIPAGLGALKHLKRVLLSYNEFHGLLPTSLINCSTIEMLQLAGNKVTGSVPVWLSILSNLEVLTLGGSSESSLEGHIPWKWGNLSNLRELYLVGDQVSGCVPSQFGRLKQLKALTLHTMTAEPMSSCKFPRQLVKLPKLELLDLIGGTLSGAIPPEFVKNLTFLRLIGSNLRGRIPKEMCQLRALYTLRLKGKFEGYIPNCFAQMQHLRRLVLAGDGLRGEIPMAIWKLPDLVMLQISAPNTTGVLPTEMCAMGKLGVLQISANMRGHIPDCVGHMKELSVLELDGTGLNGSIPEAIGMLSHLQYLDVSGNRLSGKLPLSLSKCLKLETLIVSSNNFSGQLPAPFPYSLKILSAFSNSFSGSISKSLAPCKNLMWLDLRENRLTGPIPDYLRETRMLRTLNLGCNQLEGEIPEWIVNLTELQVLDLSSNRFHGHIPANLEKLKGFSYVWNYTKNDLESDCLDVRQVPFLVVVYNPTLLNYFIDKMKVIIEQYSSKTVKMIFRQKGLELMNQYMVSYNNLIDLSCNNLTGTIPKSIGNLGKLRLLNLSQNMLSGPIPASMGKLIMLEQIDLNSNRLTGAIPEQLASIAALGVFNVSHNHLCGQIPWSTQFSTFDNSSFAGNDCLCETFPHDFCHDMNGKQNIQPLHPKDSWDWVEDNVSLIAFGLGFGLSYGATIALYCHWDAFPRYCDTYCF